MRRILLVLAVGAIMVLSSVSYAFAYANPDNNGNAGNAPGQQQAVGNCGQNIQKQNANGQTGSQTGSPNDEKQLNTAVTNCDHFWDNAGSNP
jgi:hypothetical protein